jgi:hypothetical protein
MDEKEILAAVDKSITASLKKIHGPLAILALTQLAGEFYTKAQRAALYQEYAQLRKNDTELYEAINKVRATLDDKDLGYDERVKKFGKAVAEQQMAPVMNANQRRSESIKAVDAFRREHKVLVALWQAKETPAELEWLPR